MQEKEVQMPVQVQEQEKPVQVDEWEVWDSESDSESDGSDESEGSEEGGEVGDERGGAVMGTTMTMTMTAGLGFRRPGLVRGGQLAVVAREVGADEDDDDDDGFGDLALMKTLVHSPPRFLGGYV